MQKWLGYRWLIILFAAFIDFASLVFTMAGAGTQQRSFGWLNKALFIMKQKQNLVILTSLVWTNQKQALDVLASFFFWSSRLTHCKKADKQNVYLWNYYCFFFPIGLYEFLQKKIKCKFLWSVRSRGIVQIKLKIMETNVRCRDTNRWLNHDRDALVNQKIW